VYVFEKKNISHVIWGKNMKRGREKVVNKKGNVKE
jgi:hypothetical protein